MCKTHSVQSLHRATQNERTLHTCPQNRLLQKVCPDKRNREKHGFTNRRNDVHRRPWCLITHDRILVSNLLRQARVHIKEVGASLSVYLEEGSPSPLLLGRSCNVLGYSVCAWPAGGTHSLSIGKKVIDCGFVSVEVPDKKWYHPKKSHQPWTVWCVMIFNLCHWNFFETFVLPTFPDITSLQARFLSKMENEQRSAPRTPHCRCLDSTFTSVVLMFAVEL